MKRRFTGRALIAAVVMTVAALAGSVTPASAATGSDGSILNASSGGTVHHCESLGLSYGDYRAIVCVDIHTGTYPGGYDAWGEVEAYCQVGDTTQTVPCPYIRIDGLFANAGGSVDNNSWSCNGTCGSGRQTLYISTFNYTGGHDCASSLGHNVWTVATGDTKIETPDHFWFYVDQRPNDGPNYSSGHYWVCP